MIAFYVLLMVYLIAVFHGCSISIQPTTPGKSWHDGVKMLVDPDMPGVWITLALIISPLICAGGLTLLIRTGWLKIDEA